MTITEDHLAAVHRSLLDALGHLVTGADWTAYLDLSSRFHAYSPLNVLLLMAQGASGRTAGYHTWRTIPAQDGRPCQVAKGAHGHRILAPLIRSRTEKGPDEEPVAISQLTGYKTVVVFDETQLVSPPAIPEPPTPVLLSGEGPAGLGRALAGAIAARGFRLKLDTNLAPANGLTDFAAATVSLRAGLSHAQACKTLAHELAHCELHAPGGPKSQQLRAIKEIEAESVAWLLARHAGLDAGDYSFPYLAHWAGGDLQVVAATAQRSVSAARRLAHELEQHPQCQPPPPSQPATPDIVPGHWPGIAAMSDNDGAGPALRR
jgi:hypothetical protein